MPGIAKATSDDLDTARYESKHAVKLGDDDDERLSPIVALLKLVLIRTFTIIEDLNPDWTEGLKLLNELTVKAPIASILCNKGYRTVQDGAFKLQGGTGHDTITDMYDHPDFPDGEGHTYVDLAKAAGMKTVLELASTVLRRLLGQRGELYEDIVNYPKTAFLFAVCELLDNHYMVDSQSVDDLRDRWRDSIHVTGSDMRAWIKDLGIMVRQVNIDAAHLVPPQLPITPREQARHLVKNIDTKSDSTYDNIVAKLTDALNGPKITKRDFTKFSQQGAHRSCGSQVSGHELHSHFIL